MNEPIFSGTNLHQLQLQLKSWRQRQQGRPPLPASLWQAAATLANHHGVSQVARCLGINFYRVKRLVHEGAAKGSSLPNPGPRFVELKWAAPLPCPRSGTGSVELVAGPSRRLVIHTGADPAAWVALAEAFWKAHS